MPNRKTHPLIRKQLRRSRRKRKPRRPKLRFSPYAWAKLLYLRDYGPTEIGGFGIAESEDLLCVTDFVLVQQLCTEVTVAFDDEAVADHFDEQIDRGLRPEQIGRIWLHTHPGDSAQPSHVDIETFDRVFGNCDWAIMFIIARDGDVLAQLHWRQGGPAEIPLQVEVDYALPFSGSDHDAWEQEYLDNVTEEEPIPFHTEENHWPDFPHQHLLPQDTYDHESFHPTAGLGSA